jgi:hypothetical protein
MASQKELKFAYGLAVVLFFVGVICYAAVPAKTPDEPVRVMFKVVAGNVLFDHKTHTSELGSVLSCGDCHHHYEDEESEAAEGEGTETAEATQAELGGENKPVYRACGVCHLPVMEDQPTPEACIECHEPDEIEETEMPKRSDAFHTQCETCHKDSGIGPAKDEERCSWCHFMI